MVFVEGLVSTIRSNPRFLFFAFTGLRSNLAIDSTASTSSASTIDPMTDALRQTRNGLMPDTCFIEDIVLDLDRFYYKRVCARILRLIAI